MAGNHSLYKETGKEKENPFGICRKRSMRTFMNRKNKGFSTLTALLLIANLALAALIGYSWYKERTSVEEEVLPGLLVTPPPEPTPAGNTPRPAITATPEPTAEPEVISTPEPVVSSHPEVKKDPDGRRPDYSDFDWYFNDVKEHGMWSDAEKIDNLGEVIGDWKAYILYDPDKTTDEPCEMLFNIDISVGQHDLSVLCDWYYLWDFSDEPEYQDSQSTFRGPWNNGSISASGPGTMNLTGFYAKNGKQYAVGSMTSRDGVPAVVALVRP